MNIPHEAHQEQKEAPLATAREEQKTSAAAVVDTSGLPHPLVAATASVEDDAQSLVIAAPAATADNELQLSSTTNNTLSPSSGNINNNAPTQIPVVEETVTNDSSPPGLNDPVTKSEKGVMDVDSDDGNKVMGADNDDSKAVHNEGNESEDESEYEYESDEDGAFSGFLTTHKTYGTSSSTANQAAASSSSVPARIVEEETVAAVSSGTASASAASAVIDGESEAAAPRKKWREPSRAAVSMSLRAQQETSGSKRRLAQDLYRIMNQDTEEAGFSLNPQSEDSMEKWTIKLFQFDPDSNLAKDMLVVGINHIELEMKFPEQYPFEPPFVRVVKPRFKRQTGFVMNGALCMELLTKDGWNPINDIESVIVSIRSLLVVGDGRLQAATDLTKARYETLLLTAQQEKLNSEDSGEPDHKKQRTSGEEKKQSGLPKNQVGSYTATEAQSAYSHLSDYHKKKGWDTSGWWARKG